MEKMVGLSPVKLSDAELLERQEKFKEAPIDFFNVDQFKKT